MNYPKHYDRLVKLMGELGAEIPTTLQAFQGLHKAAVTPNILTTKTKELVALGIAIAVRCDGCIAFHIHDALKAGATQAEIVETLGVAVLMGGGPALMYACEAMEALQQFEQINEERKLGVDNPEA